MRLKLRWLTRFLAAMGMLAVVPGAAGAQRAVVLDITGVIGPGIGPGSVKLWFAASAINEAFCAAGLGTAACARPQGSAVAPNLPVFWRRQFPARA